MAERERMVTDDGSNKVAPRMKVAFVGIAPRRAKSERLPFIKRERARGNFLVLNLAKLLALDSICR